MSIISIENVSKIFPSGSGEVTALKDVSLTIQRGEFVSLIGPSGCGKSTLLRLIGDLEQPTVGKLEVKGKSAAQARLDREYGIAFQAPVLFNWRTVRKNVALPLELIPKGHAVALSNRDERVERMLKLVGLEEFEEAYPWQLSGGMQQRVAIARALVFEPSILLMDEPFGALDEMTREHLQSELLKIFHRRKDSERETTIIFVTHSIQEAVFLSDRVVVMSPRPGRINEIIPVDLPRPRNNNIRQSAAFFEMVRRVRERLWGGEVKA
jgi:NitT/TauT family transport system ATP-binding protein